MLSALDAASSASVDEGHREAEDERGVREVCAAVSRIPPCIPCIGRFSAKVASLGLSQACLLSDVSSKQAAGRDVAEKDKRQGPAWHGNFSSPPPFPLPSHNTRFTDERMHCIEASWSHGHVPQGKLSRLTAVQRGICTLLALYAFS